MIALAHGFFFFNDAATTELYTLLYTLSLHDALPILILVSIARRSGMFQYLAVWSAQKARANPAGILLLLQLTTAVVSALLDNVTTVLLVVPVTLAITRELEVPPYPFLFAEVLASNIGGTAT